MRAITRLTWTGAMCLLFAVAVYGQAQSAAPDSPAAPQSGTATASSQAVVPRLMKFTGTLRDMAGKPISGAVEVTFALYSADAGGDPLWFETQSVAADEQGRYTALLGAMHTEGLPVELFNSGEARWLGVQVGNEAEQKPRVLLLSVPYALKAADAETLGGMPASAFVQAAPTTSASGAQSATNAKSFTARAVPPLSSTGTTDYIAMFTDNSGDTGNSVIYQNGSNIGIGTTNPIKPLHVAFDATGATPTIIAATGATNTNRRLLLGYETSANYGVIQSNEAGVGYTPLALNPNGGNVGIGMGTAQPKAQLQAGVWTQIPSDIVFSGGGVSLQGDFFIGNDTIPKTRMYSNGGATAFASNEYYSGTIDKPQNTSLPSWRMYMYFIGGTDYFAIQRSPAGSALAYGDVLHITSAGNMGIGTSTPAAVLEVNGTAKFDGAVTFAGGQTFPGTGTVTSVASGAGLTGGPITTSGTLSIATGGVTNAMLANPSFTVTPTSGLMGSASVSLGGNLSLGIAAGGIGNSSLANPSLTVTAGTGLSGGGSVALGSSTSLSLASASCAAGKAAVALPLSCSPFATLGANTFVGDQTVTGNISLTRALNLPSTTNAATGVINLGGLQFAHSFGTENTFVGQGAGNFSMTGASNAALGYDALASNAGGKENTASGDSALIQNTSGNDNTAVGYSALNYNNVDNNTGVGGYALVVDATGANNTAIGYDALSSISSGTGNTAIGNNAGANLGTSNSAGGSENIMVGDDAGSNFNANESNNIDIGHAGVAGESGVIRVGTVGTHTATYIAGIRGVTTGQNNAVAVLIDSNGQLGTVSSSRRYKEDIRDMGAASNGLLRLRPVTFRYKKPYDDGSKPVQYGLIAEEVNEVYPDLVAFNKDGQPETVQYYKLDAMLLNEVQKLAKEHAADQNQITELTKAQAELTKAHDADRTEIAKLQSQLAEQGKQGREQQAELSQMLAQVRVIQARLAGRSATRTKTRSAKLAAPAAGPQTTQISKKGGNRLVARVGF